MATASHHVRVSEYKLSCPLFIVSWQCPCSQQLPQIGKPCLPGVKDSYQLSVSNNWPYRIFHFKCFLSTQGLLQPQWYCMIDEPHEYETLIHQFIVSSQRWADSRDSKGRCQTSSETHANWSSFEGEKDSYHLSVFNNWSYSFKNVYFYLVLSTPKMIFSRRWNSLMSMRQHLLLLTPWSCKQVQYKKGFSSTIGNSFPHALQKIKYVDSWKQCRTHQFMPTSNATCVSSSMNSLKTWMCVFVFNASGYKNYEN